MNQKPLFLKSKSYKLNPLLYYKYKQYYPNIDLPSIEFLQWFVKEVDKISLESSPYCYSNFSFNYMSCLVNIRRKKPFAFQSDRLLSFSRPVSVLEMQLKKTEELNLKWKQNKHLLNTPSPVSSDQVYTSSLKMKNQPKWKKGEQKKTKLSNQTKPEPVKKSKFVTQENVGVSFSGFNKNASTNTKSKLSSDSSLVRSNHHKKDKSFNSLNVPIFSRNFSFLPRYTKKVAYKRGTASDILLVGSAGGGTDAQKTELFLIPFKRFLSVGCPARKKVKERLSRSNFIKFLLENEQPKLPKVSLETSPKLDPSKDAPGKHGFTFRSVKLNNVQTRLKHRFIKVFNDREEEMLWILKKLKSSSSRLSLKFKYDAPSLETFARIARFKIRRKYVFDPYTSSDGWGERREADWPHLFDELRIQNHKRRGNLRSYKKFLRLISKRNLIKKLIIFRKNYSNKKTAFLPLFSQIKSIQFWPIQLRNRKSSNSLPHYSCDFVPRFSDDYADKIRNDQNHVNFNDLSLQLANASTRSKLVRSNLRKGKQKNNPLFFAIKSSNLDKLAYIKSNLGLGKIVSLNKHKHLWIVKNRQDLEILLLILKGNLSIPTNRAELLKFKYLISIFNAKLKTLMNSNPVKPKNKTLIPKPDLFNESEGSLPRPLSCFSKIKEEKQRIIPTKLDGNSLLISPVKTNFDFDNYVPFLSNYWKNKKLQQSKREFLPSLNAKVEHNGHILKYNIKSKSYLNSVLLWERYKTWSRFIRVSPLSSLLLFTPFQRKQLLVITGSKQSNFSFLSKPQIELNKVSFEHSRIRNSLVDSIPLHSASFVGLTKLLLSTGDKVWREGLSVNQIKKLELQSQEILLDGSSLRPARIEFPHRELHRIGSVFSSDSSQELVLREHKILNMYREPMRFLFSAFYKEHIEGKQEKYKVENKSAKYRLLFSFLNLSGEQIKRLSLKKGKMLLPDSGLLSYPIKFIRRQKKSGFIYKPSDLLNISSTSSLLSRKERNIPGWNYPFIPLLLPFSLPKERYAPWHPFCEVSEADLKQVIPFLIEDKSNSHTETKLELVRAVNENKEKYSIRTRASVQLASLPRYTQVVAGKKGTPCDLPLAGSAGRTESNKFEPIKASVVEGFTSSWSSSLSCNQNKKEDSLPKIEREAPALLSFMILSFKKLSRKTKNDTRLADLNSYKRRWSKMTKQVNKFTINTDLNFENLKNKQMFNYLINHTLASRSKKKSLKMKPNTHRSLSPHLLSSVPPFRSFHCLPPSIQTDSDKTRSNEKTQVRNTKKSKELATLKRVLPTSDGINETKNRKGQNNHFFHSSPSLKKGTPCDILLVGSAGRTKSKKGDSDQNQNQNTKGHFAKGPKSKDSNRIGPKLEPMKIFGRRVPSAIQTQLKPDSNRIESKLEPMETFGRRTPSTIQTELKTDPKKEVSAEKKSKNTAKPLGKRVVPFQDNHFGQGSSDSFLKETKSEVIKKSKFYKNKNKNKNKNKLSQQDSNKQERPKWSGFPRPSPILKSWQSSTKFKNKISKKEKEHSIPFYPTLSRKERKEVDKFIAKAKNEVRIEQNSSSQSDLLYKKELDKTEKTNTEKKVKSVITSHGSNAVESTKSSNFGFDPNRSGKKQEWFYGKKHATPFPFFKMGYFDKTSNRDKTQFLNTKKDHTAKAKQRTSELPFSNKQKKGKIWLPLSLRGLVSTEYKQMNKFGDKRSSVYPIFKTKLLPINISKPWDPKKKQDEENNRRWPKNIFPTGYTRRVKVLNRDRILFSFHKSRHHSTSKLGYASFRKTWWPWWKKAWTRERVQQELKKNKVHFSINSLLVPLLSRAKNVISKKSKRVRALYWSILGSFIREGLSFRFRDLRSQKAIFNNLRKSNSIWNYNLNIFKLYHKIVPAANSRFFVAKTQNKKKYARDLWLYRYWLEIMSRPDFLSYRPYLLKKRKFRYGHKFRRRERTFKYYRGKRVSVFCSNF